MEKIQKSVSVLLSLIMVVSLFSIVPVAASATVVTNDDFTVNTSGTVYTIKNAAGWDIFCANVNSGGSFSGKTVMLSGNIGSTSYPVTMSAGSGYTHSFSGMFDGDGKRLYFEGSAGNPAPFAFLVGTESDPASVSNLNVVSTTDVPDSDVIAGLIGYTAGYAEVTDCDVDVQLSTSTGTNNPTDLFTAGLVARAEDHLTVSGCSVTGEIATNGKFASGLVGRVFGTADIENCMSDVTIYSSVGGEGRHGGLVGQIGQTGTLNLTGCLFNGKLLTTGSVDTGSCGGLLGISNKNSCTITDCVYDPAPIESGENEAAAGSGTLYTGKTATVDNCYYTRALGSTENQGKQAHEIIAGENVIFYLSGEETEYDVSGITAYDGNSGLRYNDTYYAGAGDEVSLRFYHYGYSGYYASPGTLENGVLTMPDEAVTINTGIKSRFDAQTGTLTLKGDLVKQNAGNGMLLPDGLQKTDVLHVVVDDAGATFPMDSSVFFVGFTNLKTVDLTNADTSSVTNMSNMFNSCKALESVDMSGIDAGSVTNMRRMFNTCEALESVDMSGIDTGSVTNLSEMFALCRALESLDLSGFEISSGCNTEKMFYMSSSGNALKTIYVSEKWNNTNIGDSYGMFAYCVNLEGGNGTAYKVIQTDKKYACIDRDGQPGYFTAKCTLTIADTQHGKVTADKTGTVVQGETVTLTAEPDDNYVPKTLTVTDADGSEIEVTGNQFTMPDKAVTVTAEFEITDYGIIIPETEHGTVTAFVNDAPAAAAYYNDTVTLNVQPDDGYYLKSLAVSDGYGNRIAVNNKQFSMPGTAATVTAEFAFGNHTHTDADNRTILFQPWTSTNSLPKSGSYYLTDNVVLGMTTYINGELNLCLNGKTITYESGSFGTVFCVDNNDTLNLYDEDGDHGVITGGRGYYDGNEKTGGAVYIDFGTFNMYGGTISNNTVYCGGGVYVKAGVFNMYGGIISGNRASWGGGVANYGTFTLYDGLITDNSAEYGGGVLVDYNVYTNPVFNLNGGTITGNTATYGGGIISCTGEYGAFNLSGGTVSDNTADQGNNIAMYDYYTINITGPLGGNVYDVALTFDDVLFTTGVFTSGLSGKGTAANFTNGNGEKYILTLNDDGEAELVFNPAHYEEDGDTVILHDATGWEIFCDQLEQNVYGYYTGKTVKMGDSFTITRMANRFGQAFTGTFDGNGKTLTVNLTITDGYIRNIAPFYYAENAAFRNIRVEGFITANRQFSAGIVSLTSGTTSITNCISSVTINSSVNGNGSHGGFVGKNYGGKLTFTGCVFNGRIIGEKTDNIGGFAGWTESPIEYADCLFAPSEITCKTDGSANFNRYDPDNDDVELTFSNTYYTWEYTDTTQFTAEQGKKAYTVTSGNGATLDFGTPAATYSVSGLTAYAAGVAFDGTFYAGCEDNVSLTVKPDEGYAVTSVTVNGEPLAPVEGAYSFEMPDENVTVSATFVLIGNVNRDGYIDVRDVTAIQKHLAELDSLSEEQLIAADTNGDGYINIADATHLQMYLAQFDVVLGKQPQANS